MKHISLPLIICLCISQAFCQSSQKFVIHKKATLVLSDEQNDFNPQVKNRHLPKPDHGADDIEKEKAKKEIANRYPKKYAAYDERKLNVINPPAMLRNFIGNAFNGYVPNDNDMAIGNNDRVCSVTNTTIWTKNIITNQIFGTYNLHTITSVLGLQQEEFDPKIIYDHVSNRFVFVCLNGFTDSTSNVIIGFSQSDTTNGAWNFYALPGNPLNNSLWTDFPMLSLSGNDLFITVNLLYNDSSWQTGFNESLIWQMNKYDGYNGNTLNAQLHNNILHNGAPLRNLCPVRAGWQLNSPGMTFLSNRNFSTGNDTIFLVTVSDTAFAPGQVVAVQALQSNHQYRMPVDADQPFTDKLATNDARILGAFSNGLDIQFVGNTTDTATGNVGIYHGMIHPVGPTYTVTASTLADTAMDLAYANLAPVSNHLTNDSSIIGFLKSSATVNPGMGAVLFDGYTQYSPILNVRSGVSYISMISGTERWGDYSGCQVKYNQPGIVWVSGTYSFGNHTTRTWIAELSGNGITDINILPAKSESANVFPNPADENITVAFTNPQNQVLCFELYNAQNQLVHKLYNGSLVKGENEFSFALNKLNAGIYFLKVTGSKSGQVLTEKVIKR